MRYKVLLYAGGRMGELARDVLEQHPNVELMIADTTAGHDRRPCDILFSASYPTKIPAGARHSVSRFSVNIHTGLLPEGRGSHPLNWAIIWGKTKTGITIHEITDTYDAGDIVAQTEIPIFERDTIRELRARVETLFPSMIAAFFDDPETFWAGRKPQNQAHASYAQKRTPADGEVNWEASDAEIYNFIRAHDPDEYPAFTYKDGQKMRVRLTRERRLVCVEPYGKAPA